ncbi:MAG: PD-(D/E)XK nuclease domain-containing protein, partial [Peptococcaceae bacterium]|nr:PD-(D/E)XK nuclease domain-containing protein [Peptococcaceae bacterium]
MNIVAEFTEKDEDFAESAYRRMKESLKAGELQNVLEILKSLFASIPYQLHMKHEHYYHAIFYTLMNLLGFNIVAEESVSGGRIDAVLELDDKVYVIEFKYVGCDSDALPEDKRVIYDKALDEGMRQINNKGYAKKYTGSGKVVYKVAFAFLGRDYIEFKMEL